MLDRPRERRWPYVAGAIATVALVAAAILTRTGGHSEQAPAAAAAQTEADAAAAGRGAGAPPGVGEPGRDASGAAEVAVRVATASQRWLYLTDDQVRAEVTGMATPGASAWLADETVAEIRLAREQLGVSPGPVWWLVRPMASQIERADAQAARVSVWVVTVLSAVEVAAPQSEWMTITIDLNWTPDGWRVDNVAEEPGPTPMTGPHDDPWDAVPFDQALDGYVRLDGDPVQPGTAP